jgi:3-methyladenine DNA glycosylase AlkD
MRELGQSEEAAFLQRFFKTGPGEYGEGDRFLGIRVPVTRKLAREFRALPIDDIERLLHEPWHELRLLAVILLSDRYPSASPREQDAIYRLYLRNTAHINNWDIVDISAPHVVGAHLLHRSRRVLDRLARSRSLWERRIAIIATLRFIREHQFDDTLRIARSLLNDPHDLIHKAGGWMLREVGNRAPARLHEFLDTHAPVMPRTMLRYAIEKLPEESRQQYLRAHTPTPGGFETRPYR